MQWKLPGLQTMKMQTYGTEVGDQFYVFLFFNSINKKNNGKVKVPVS